MLKNLAIIITSFIFIQPILANYDKDKTLSYFETIETRLLDSLPENKIKETIEELKEVIQSNPPEKIIYSDELFYHQLFLRLFIREDGSLIKQELNQFYKDFFKILKEIENVKFTRGDHFIVGYVNFYGYLFSAFFYNLNLRETLLDFCKIQWNTGYLYDDFFRGMRDNNGKWNNLKSLRIYTIKNLTGQEVDEKEIDAFITKHYEKLLKIETLILYVQEDFFDEKQLNIKKERNTKNDVVTLREDQIDLKKSENGKQYYKLYFWYPNVAGLFRDFMMKGIAYNKDKTYYLIDKTNENYPFNWEPYLKDKKPFLVEKYEIKRKKNKNYIDTSIRKMQKVIYKNNTNLFE